MHNYLLNYLMQKRVVICNVCKHSTYLNGMKNVVSRAFTQLHPNNPTMHSVEFNGCDNYYGEEPKQVSCNTAHCMLM